MSSLTGKDIAPSSGPSFLVSAFILVKDSELPLWGRSMAQRLWEFWTFSEGIAACWHHSIIAVHPQGIMQLCQLTAYQWCTFFQH